MDSTGQIKTQHAICQVMVGGAICGKRMAMPQASTTGPRNHLNNMHPKIWVEMTAIAQAKIQVKRKRGAARALNEAMDIIEGANTNFYLNTTKFWKIIENSIILYIST